VIVRVGVRHAPVEVVVARRPVYRLLALVTIALAVAAAGLPATVVVGDDVIAAVAGVVARADPGDGEVAVPGGQELEVPPQHEHRKPSIAQYFQYSQLSGLSGLASLPQARPPRSTGNSGRSAAPVSSWPREASRLRREVRRASEREECSNR